ncbi:MAG TPA: tripartite tricarboxylate transporter TctB family protein [Blastococcus sp.]|nr:tripartite tricarboxylate transporter TctB family protein [Blastococcus sp.]
MTTRAAETTPSTLHDLEEAVHQLEHDAEHRPPPAGTTTNLVVATLVVALGAAALVGSLSLGAGSAGNPGSGTWPLVLSIVIIVLGLGLAATARTTSDAERFSRSSWLVLAGLATMVVFVALVSVIGFEIPAALLAFVWLRFLGGEGWRTSIVTSIGVVVAFYLIFVAALSVPIPHLF